MYTNITISLSLHIGVTMRNRSNDLFNKNDMVNVMMRVGFENSEAPADKDNRDEDALFLFLDIFGSSICGHQNYNTLDQQRTRFQDCSTVSDEALGIFFIEKNWEKWDSQVHKENGGTEDCFKIHDTGGIVYTKLHSNKKFGGWTNSAMERFTTIARMVSTSRRSKRRQDLEEKYMIYKRSQNPTYTLFNTHADMPNEKEKSNEIIKPYNDLMIDLPKVTCNTETNTNHPTIFSFSKHSSKITPTFLLKEDKNHGSLMEDASDVGGQDESYANDEDDQSNDESEDNEDSVDL